jgi:hypothetical protein
MEVHHHPKVENPAHGGTGKKFKEYFFEFLMIFLAVTLGFFAENIRENIANHVREISYMQGIVNDLKADTSEIRFIIRGQDFMLKQFEAALSISPQQLHNAALQDSFYHHYMYFYSFTVYFIAHNKTISQLRNNGGLTIISQQNVIDSISELNHFYDYYEVVDNGAYNDLYMKTIEEGAKVISCPPLMSSMNLPVPSISHDLPAFIRDDLTTTRELYNYINMEKGQLEQCMSAQENYRTKAGRLITFINKEYHFNNE